MRVLLDECLPAELRRILIEMSHECQTVRQASDPKRMVSCSQSRRAGGTSCSPVIATSNISRTCRTQRVDRHPARQVQSHEGSPPAHVRLSGGSSHHPTRSGRRGGAPVAKNAQPNQLNQLIVLSRQILRPNHRPFHERRPDPLVQRNYKLLRLRAQRSRRLDLLHTNIDPAKCPWPPPQGCPQSDGNCGSSPTVKP